MRIVFMGTPAFAAPALQALIDAGHDIIAVYTQPPRPAGRGHKLHKSAVHELAEQHGIEVRTPVNFKQDSDHIALKDLNADIGVVAAYGLILPQTVLDAPKHGCLNIHGSLLPRWRGAAPIHRALLAGDTETGITIMRMAAGLDTGPMLLKNTTSIAPTDTVQDIHDRLAVMGAQLLVETLHKLDELPEVVQPEDGVTYAHKVAKDEGILHGMESADDIDRMVRAFTPWPGVWFTHKDQRFKILEGFARIANSAPGASGDILSDGGFLCAPSDGALRSIYQITKLQAPSGKAMSVQDAINGGLIAPCA